MSKLLAVCHIPKTAGLSLAYLLQRHFGRNHLAVVYGKHPTEYHVEDLRRDLKLNPSLQSISAHGLKPFNSFEEFDQELIWVTFLREPAARYISHYQYQINQGKEQRSFSDWMKDTSHDNWQVRSIAGSGGLESAKQILLEKFQCVGLVDHFNESVLLMRERCGLTDFRVAHTRFVNASHDYDMRDAIEDRWEEYADEVYAHNQQDMDLYDFVKRIIWPAQVNDYGAQRLETDSNIEFTGLQSRWVERYRHLQYRVYMNLIYRPYIRLIRRRTL